MAGANPKIAPKELAHPNEMLKELMQAKNLSLEALAANSNLAHAEIQSLLDGASYPSPRQSKALGDVFGLGAKRFWHIGKAHREAHG